MLSDRQLRYLGIRPQHAGSVVVDNLPEGRHTYTAAGIDPVLNAGAGNAFTARIDRTPPHVEDLNGSLVANKDAIDPSQSYTLSVSATDGNSANPDTMQSGVTTIRVNDVGPAGTSQTIWSDTQPCASDFGSCRMPPAPNRQDQITFTIPAWTFTTAGSHRIQVIATDAVGRDSDDANDREVTINVVEDDTPPAVQIVSQAVQPDGSQTIQFNLSDSGTVRSGVSGLELYLDDQLLQTFEEPCSLGTCPLTKTWSVTLGPGQSLADHQLAAIPADKWGNESYGKDGAKKDIYEFLGYNEGFINSADPERDEPTATRLDKAKAGNARVIRQGVAWCHVQPNNETQWKWSPTDGGGEVDYDGFFDDVAARGLKVVAVLGTSPVWATDLTSGSGCPSGNNSNSPPRNTAAMIDAYGTFVRKFVKKYAGDRLTAIGAFNEPNLGVFWGHPDQQTFNPQPQLYAKLYRAARQGIADADVPEGQKPELLVAGLAPTGAQNSDDRSVVGFMRAATSPNYDQRIAPNMTPRISVHLYSNLDTSTNENKAKQKLQAEWEDVKNSLDNLGNPDGAEYASHRNRMWITEVGFPSRHPLDTNPPSDSSNHTDRTQANRLLGAYHPYAARARAFIVHRLYDGDSEPNKFGVLRGDFTIKGPQAQSGAYCRLAAVRAPSDPVECQ